MNQAENRKKSSTQARQKSENPITYLANMLVFTLVNRSGLCRVEKWLNFLLKPVVLHVCVLYNVLGRWEESQPLYPLLCSAALVFQETQPI